MSEERFPGYEEDAWRKMLLVVEENTKQWQPRSDLEVTALGCDRAVRVSIAGPTPEKFRMRSWYDTGPRNVSTMREFAQAILDACDFVDEVNPKWASNARERAQDV